MFRSEKQLANDEKFRKLEAEHIKGIGLQENSFNVH